MSKFKVGDVVRLKPEHIADSRMMKTSTGIIRSMGEFMGHRATVNIDGKGLSNVLISALEHAHQSPVDKISHILMAMEK